MKTSSVPDELYQHGNTMEIQATRRTWERSENLEDDQKGFGISNFLNGLKIEDVFQIIDEVWCN